MQATSATFLLAMFVTAGLAHGDVVHLNDGRSIEGDVKRTAEGYTVVVDGESTHFTAAEVKSIEVGTSAIGPGRDAGLGSLRRSMVNTTDPQQAIDRYKRFITANEKTAPVPVEMAKADLLIWQDRADRKLEKLGDKWVTKAQADETRAKAVAELSNARDMLFEGRTKDARAIIETALQADAQNPAALYLRGLLAFSDGDIPLARRSYDAAATALPEAHGPTLNNLAVVMMRQNQTAGALNAYTRALQAPASSTMLLDNVAEALNSASGDNKLSTAVKKTAAVFQPIDVAVAQQMAKQGLYRWGPTWLPKEEIEKIKTIEKQINEQIAQFELEFNSAQNEARTIEDEIASNERAMRRMEANSFLRDELTGRIIKTELPRAYYQLQRDTMDLVNMRQRVNARVDQVRNDAKAARAKLPKPRYTGAQRLIGPEGAPGLPPPAMPQPPAEQPAPANAPPAVPPGLIVPVPLAPSTIPATAPVQ